MALERVKHDNSNEAGLWMENGEHERYTWTTEDPNQTKRTFIIIIFII